MSAGSVCDELYEDKAIKRVGRVDLGMLEYTYANTASYVGFHAGFNNPLPRSLFTAICSFYPFVGHYSKVKNKTCGYIFYNNIIINDIDFNGNATLFKQAMSGVYLYYELETPITYTLDTPLDLSYKVDDFGTESILGANVSTINTTKFNGNIKYALNAADTIRNLQTNYVSTYENQGLDEERKSNARKNIGVEGIVDKADKSGIYPDLVAGNLVDEKNTGSAQVIMGLRTSCGTDSIVDDGYAQIKRIKGNSIVWNQKISATSYNTTVSPVNGIYRILYETNSIRYYGTCTVTTQYTAVIIFNNVNGHKYYLHAVSNDSNISTVKSIITYYGTGHYSWGYSLYENKTYDFISKINWIDLTQMFGAGNEPTTAEFDTLFPHIKYELSKTKDT